MKETNEMISKLFKAISHFLITFGCILIRNKHEYNVQLSFFFYTDLYHHLLLLLLPLAWRSSSKPNMLQSAKNRTKQSAIICTIPVLLAALMFQADFAKFKNYIELPANKMSNINKSTKTKQRIKLLISYTGLSKSTFCSPYTFYLFSVYCYAWVSELLKLPSVFYLND